MKRISVLLGILFYIQFDLFSQREQDSLALVALYNSTNGANWTNNTNWLSSEPISKWFGISFANNRVEEINLLENNLNGSIPKNIGNLTNLKILNLSFNPLVGSIPPEIGELTNLNSLHLVRNQLSGSIPTQIGNLTKLRSLMLVDTQLSGTIPNEICNLVSLVDLQISVNPLSGSIPSDIGNLINLHTLYLWHDQLTGTIPPEIGNLKNLGDLCLSENYLTGTIPPEIGNLTKLGNLNLFGNQLVGKLPREIGNLISLNNLYLMENQLTGLLPSEIGNLVNLTDLRLCDNQFYGSIPDGFSNFTKLNCLFIRNNKFDKLPKLNAKPNYLFIYNNRLDFGDIEPNFTIAQIEFLYAPQDNIGEEQNLKGRLNKSITLSVTCGGEHNIYQWKKDNVLIPNANSPTFKIQKLQLTDAGSYTCDVTNTVITDLTISSRPINLSIMLYGRDIDSLALISIYNGNGGENWIDDTNWLSQNPISEWFGVTVANNTGTKGLSDTTGVVRLDLSGNNLTGTIPSAIGNMTGLLSLDLNSNNLMGKVPAEINNIPSLQELNLSNNKLDDIPKLLFMSLDILELGQNLFTFEDIEPNINVSGIKFDYLLQDSIGIRKDTICFEGTDISFIVKDSALYNNYQWFKDGVEIPFEEENTLIFNNLQLDDAGKYHCSITNTAVPNLTLYSRPIKLSIYKTTGIVKEFPSTTRIYPNPNNGILKIESSEGFNDNSSLEVIDIYGKRVTLKIIENIKYQEVDLSQLIKGMYFIRLKSGRNNINQKLLIR